MRFLYDAGIFLFSLGVKLAVPFNKQAALMSRGRTLTWKRLAAARLDGEVFWVHCASLGEFEQGRPLIEALRERRQGCKIVLTFFSPSGYEVRKDNVAADVVVYLPSDTRENARRFLNEIRPAAAFFVKYEYWYHYFRELNKANVPLYLVSAIFREDQVFFKLHGSWFRKILSRVTKFFLQDSNSARLLERIGINNFVISGDTRFDRVSAVAAASREIPAARLFAAGHRVIVAGSTWPPDEEILAKYMNMAPADVRLIIAPHHVGENRVEAIKRLFNAGVVTFSSVDSSIPDGARVLVIDSIGLLSSLYRYGSIAYIGGGFGKGIHNTLEAATYSVPVIFGPNYKKFKEAVDLEGAGAAFPVSNHDDFARVITQIWESCHSPGGVSIAGGVAGNYVKSNQGATSVIINDIFPR